MILLQKLDGSLLELRGSLECHGDAIRVNGQILVGYSGNVSMEAMRADYNQLVACIKDVIRDSTNQFGFIGTEAWYTDPAESVPGQADSKS